MDRSRSARVFVMVVGAVAALSLSNLAHAAAPKMPHVSALSKTFSGTEGGARITVRGSNFAPHAVVSFGATPGRSVKVASSSALTVTVPSHSAGMVDVRVKTGSGVSQRRVADHFTFVGTPNPVTSLSLLDSTRTTLTMSWQVSDSDASRIVVRRATGSVAPSSPTGGTLATSLPITSTAWTDSQVQPGQKYSYSLFTATSVGPIYSRATHLTATVPTSSRPDMPTDVVMTPRARGGATACSSSSPYGLVPSSPRLRFSAEVTEPDGSPVRADFRVWDMASGSPVPVIGADSPTGQTGEVNGSGSVSLSLDSSLLTPNDVYKTDAVADNGEQQSASTAPCYFIYAPTRPEAPTVTAGQSTYRVGTPATFTFTDADLGTPAIDHFGWTLGSADDLDGDGGTHVAVTRDQTSDTDSATITFTPETWAEHYLYVQAVDKSGNVSSVVTISFYVADN